MSILVPQLGRGSEYRGNCGPASVCSALRWATDHDVAPLPDDVRKAMRDFVGGTTMGDHPKGYNAFIDDAWRAGWTLPPMTYAGNATWGQFFKVLRAGNAATIAIDYSKVPARFRCAAFNGLHSVFVSELRTKAGKREAKVWDPLADGRRPGIPRGPQWYPVEVLRDAAAGAARPGRAMFNIVKSGMMQPRDPKHPNPDAEPVEGMLREG